MNLRTAREIEKHLIERLLVKIQAKVDPAVHYLFRLAKYEEGNADKWLLRTARPKRPEL